MKKMMVVMLLSLMNKMAMMIGVPNSEYHVCVRRLHSKLSMFCSFCFCFPAKDVFEENFLPWIEDKDKDKDKDKGSAE